MFWKARVTIYVYDGKTGCRERGGGFLTGVSAYYVQKAKFLVSPVKDAAG